MTDQAGHQHDAPQRPAPGRPLWLAAEQARLSKFNAEDLVPWTTRIGIGRTTYRRLSYQEERPIVRTVKKIAQVIGMPLPDAMRLAGYPADDVPQAPVQDHVTARARLEIQALREIAERTGATLADVLIQYNLAAPDELKFTTDEIVEEIRNDADLPDDLRKEFLEGYRRLREQVAESARRRESSG